MPTTSTKRIATVCAAACLTLGLAATAHAQPEPIEANPLTDRQTFTDDVTMRITQTVDGLPEQVMEFDDASNLMVVEFTIQPGAVFPWHTHPGTVLISIVEGDLVFVFAEDCVRRDYAAGTALVDPGFDNVHTAYNPSEETETRVIATLIGAPDEGPVTVPVDEAEGAALDEECGIER